MSVHFYKDLKSTDNFKALADPGLYTQLPDDWCLAVSDVRDSTNQIKNGRYKDVNLIGASIIAAICNTVKETELPFSFGGDGSIIAFPNKYRKEAEQISKGCRKHARENFNLDLAAGVIPVSELYEAGHNVLLAKFQTSEYVSQASFMGDGVLIAEEWIKERSEADTDFSTSSEIDLSGLECRWNPFPADELAISLIIDVAEAPIEDQFDIYQSVLDGIYQIFDDRTSSPVKQNDMNLTLRLKNLWAETKLRSRNSLIYRIAYFLKLIFLQVSGFFFMNYNISTYKTDWGDYKPDFIKNSDYRKFSQSLKMIITGSSKMKDELTHLLESYFQEGKLVYGIHVTDSTVTTCFVKEYQRNHIHFIDGTGGGYTKASIGFKRRLKEISKMQLSSVME